MVVVVAVVVVAGKEGKEGQADGKPPRSGNHSVIAITWQTRILIRGCGAKRDRAFWFSRFVFNPSRGSSAASFLRER